MSAIFSTNGNGLGVLATNGTCRVFALYQDSSARIKTMQMCERLLEQFSDDLVFDFSWLNYQRLGDPMLAARATDAADWADIVIFCGHSDDLPPVVVRWLNDWVSTGRKHSKRAIALLHTAPLGASAMVGALRHRLETAASALGMDFLPLVATGQNVFAVNGQQTFLASHSSTDPLDNLQYRWGLNE